MPAARKYELNGRVVDRATNDGAAGLRVEAWDKDARRDDALGHAHTDVKGLFTISFDRSAFSDKGRDRLPDIYFRVFHGDELLLDTAETFARDFKDWATPFELVVELPGARRTRSGVRDALATTTAANVTAAPVSAEVAIHEFGQSVAATVASVQRELLRYPTEVGTYVLEEIDLNIPVRMRVDQFGQVMAATVTDSQPHDASIGQVRMRLRPLVGAPPPPPAPSTPNQSLKTLNALPPETIRRLEEQRIFSVDDLMRVSNTPAGRAALEKSDLGVPLQTVMDKAAVLSLPIPSQVSEALLKDSTIKSPADIITKSPEQLAQIVQQKTNLPVSRLDFLKWRQDVEQFVTVPLPSQQSGGTNAPGNETTPTSTTPTTTPTNTDTNTTPTTSTTTPVTKPTTTTESGPIISPPPPQTTETEFVAKPSTETFEKTGDGTTTPPTIPP
ncbi:MAG TPA: hypothetical protein VEQ42_03140, partial [Pyrinomonadaceae bacterium]|nr:hypothetical protein [Pyrinomonadaceae bacterium]